MKLRSLLFVPADRPERFVKAAQSGADAIILDLEDSVSLGRKDTARAAAADWLTGERPLTTFVRLNPLDSAHVDADLAAIAGTRPDGIMLPKAEGDASVRALLDRLGDSPVPILPIATETPAAIFEMGSYRAVAGHLAGVTWGAEDLPAAIGALTSRSADGSYTAPYQMVRALTLFAAHAAHVAAIETVYPAIKDEAGLAVYAARGAHDGFTGMLALHPAQVPIINAAFTPGDEAVAHARAVVDAFAAVPDAGVLMLDGQMIDAPHLLQARKILERAGVTL
ncbi:HpcH/HpaI aldolase/citrate lyase family protein [Novosphingobium aquimarinum]|uniref:HpcH/HpaI aldolase/citrate lyase family protein n=1 Tax=Novosphingobium aquimarinum TaxID=2682494 RepID=UPI0012ECAD50|nr:CoA ester lyase [Novosphingobium aquimarinum]